MANKERGRGKIFKGTVRSNKMEKTVIVEVNSKVKHPFYGKYIKYRKRFFAHDARNECKIGDTVEITECSPISKNKCWRVTKIIQKAEAA